MKKTLVSMAVYLTIVMLGACALAPASHHAPQHPYPQHDISSLLRG